MADYPSVVVVLTLAADLADAVERSTKGDPERQAHRNVVERDTEGDADARTERDSRTWWHNVFAVDGFQPH